MSVVAKASCTTTCASETDDGDYETSSEGAIRGPQRKPLTDISPRSSDKMSSEPDDQAETLKLKDEKSSEESSYSQDIAFPTGLLVKSESMPMLKSISSSDKEENEEGNIALTSESSLARRKKMKMIVARIGPLLSSISNLTVSTDTSRPEVVNESFVPKKLESKIILPVLEDMDSNPPSCSKEVTFHDPPQDEELSKERARSNTFHRAHNNRQDPGLSQEFDDLIDIAENPHPSIKSIYFPPIYEKDNFASIPRQRSRVTKDLDAISKIDGVLRPLQHKLNELTGKVRAMNLTNPSLLNQTPYSSQYTPSSNNISGYYLRPTETLDRDSSIANCLTRDCPPRDCRASDYFGNRTFQAVNEESVPITPVFPAKNTTNKSMKIGQQNSYSFMNPERSLSRCAGVNSSNMTNSWPIAEDDSYVSARNSYFQFGGQVEKDLSGSLIPSMSSSCYRCHRHGAYDFHTPHMSSYYDETEHGGGYSGYAKQNETMATSSKPVEKQNSIMETENIDKLPQVVGSEERETLPLTRTLTGTIIAPRAGSGSKVRLISINTSVEKHYTGLIKPDQNSNLELTEKNHQDSKKNSDSSFETPQNQSVSASLTVIGSDGSSKTRFVNYTRVNSQASLIVSKDQNVMTSEIDYSQKKKNLRDLDVQCSGFNLKYQQKEIVVRKSVDKLVKASPSEETNKSAMNPNSIQLAKVDEKVVIVPILFTDGVPEPPKAPLFNFTRSRHHVHRSSNHHILKLEKRSSSITQDSIYSGNSADSTAMESSHTSHKLMHRNSGMSMSCVSRTGSSLRCKNPSHLTSTTKAYSDYHHSKGRHNHSSKAHSEPTKRVMKKVIHGMRSSPEDFLCDT